MVTDELIDKLAGRFLVIDGPDGAGKSTQVHLLAGHLRTGGGRVRTVRDPGGTAIGDRIRGVLLDPACSEMAVECELMLYMASRAQLVNDVIRPELDDRTCVLSDRYVSSTIAYQGAGGVSAEDVRTVAEIATGGTWPDLTILLDLPADEGLRRVAGQLDRVESKGIHYHRAVREAFLAESRKQPKRFAVVDAAQDVEAVQQEIRSILRRWTFPRSMPRRHC